MCEYWISIVVYKILLYVIGLKSLDKAILNFLLIILVIYLGVLPPFSFNKCKTDMANANACALRGNSSFVWTGTTFWIQSS